MRAFFAINLPENIRHELYEIEQEMKKFLPSINWVKQENLHLTLKFMGDVRGEDLDALLDIASAHFLRFNPFTTNLKDISIFPAVGPRIIYTKLHSPELSEFVEKFIGVIDALEFVIPENRTFLPHVTLGRVREELNKFHIDQIQNLEYRNSFLINSVELMQAKLRPSGPVYSVIKSFELHGTH